jgi:hypothetical protein
MAHDFYYILLLEKSNGNVKKEYESKILSFTELRDYFYYGKQDYFLSFTDNVFYYLLDLTNKCILLNSNNEKLKIYANLLTYGTAPKVVGYEEYFATEDEHNFHNSFFTILRNESKLKELSEISKFPLDYIFLPPNHYQLYL